MKGAAWIILFMIGSFCRAQNPHNPQAKKQSLSEKKEPVSIYVGGSMGKAFTNLNTGYLIDTWTGAYDCRLYFSRGIWCWLLAVQDIPAVDLRTGWKQVHAMYYDFNLNLAREENAIQLYPIFGITYESVSALSPGFSYTQINTPITEHVFHAGYWGGNGGGGINIRAHKKIRVFGEMKFRIMRNGGSMGYNELLFCCGIRVGVAQFRLRKIFRKPGDKYHWF